MHYRKLSLSGFGPHTTEKEFTFPNGSVVITGSNGSGKTTVIDAISWAIHGPKAALRSVKDRTSVINTSSQTAKVTLVVDKDNETLTINRSLTRSGGHTLKVRINGNVYEGGITIAQEVINDFFGAVNASLYTHIATLSSAPSQPVNPFISSDDASRRKFLAELVDPDGDFEKTNKAVRVRLRDDKKELTRLEGKLSGVMDNAPNEPNASRLSEVEQEIIEHEHARRQQEQRMSASRTRDDVQIAGLIATHRSESESLDTRINEMTTTLNKLNDNIDITKNRIEEIEEDIERENKRLDKSEIRVTELTAEITALDTRITHHKKKIKVLSSRRDFLRSQKMASEQLLSMSEQSTDSCVLCGSDITDTAHDHLLGLHDSISDLNGRIAVFDKDISSSENLIDTMEDYRENLVRRKNKIDPVKIRNGIDALYDKLDQNEDRYEDLKKRVSDINRDLGRIQENKQEHDRMIDQLSGDIDPEVLRSQDEMNDAWTFISDSLADLHSERTKIENNITAWDRFQETVASIEYEIKRLGKVIAQLNILKDQTSPTGAISTMIADVAQSVSHSATEHLLETFDRDAVVEIVSSVTEGDATCRITVDGRDLSTHSHGEQSRFIAAILTALAETSQETIGTWIPLIWDEPTMASDLGITVDFIDMVSDQGQRQAFILTRDDYPVDHVTRSVVL